MIPRHSGVGVGPEPVTLVIVDLDRELADEQFIAKGQARMRIDLLHVCGQGECRSLETRNCLHYCKTITIIAPIAFPIYIGQTECRIKTRCSHLEPDVDVRATRLTARLGLVSLFTASLWVSIKD